MKIIPYCAIFGGYDTLLDATYPSTCITDLPQRHVKGWQFQIMSYLVPPKIRSFYCKTHPHIVVPQADVTIWIDGNVQLRVDPRYLVDKFLVDHDIALYQHPVRDCIYLEGAACVRLRKARFDVVETTLKWLRAQGYPEHNGLAETSFIIRRDTLQIRELNELWWQTFLSQPAKRDQLSFNYACWKLGISYREISGYTSSSYIRWKRHQRSRPR